MVKRLLWEQKTEGSIPSTLTKIICGRGGTGYTGHLKCPAGRIVGSNPTARTKNSEGSVHRCAEQP